MTIIDMRSDTVTKPTDEMREAAKNAEVGDDVFGDDPTVMELEKYAAELLGKEAALFVSSGTQGNLVALMTHLSRGEEVLLEEQSHIFNYEVGGVSAIVGAFPRTFTSDRGYQSNISMYLRPDNIHYPRTKLLCIENTHNKHGGAALSVDQIQSMARQGKENGLKVHLDGARLFNAVAHYNVDVKEYTKHVDSVQICLSKGLSAPVGSILAGDTDFISLARRNRKTLGGGMRQVGIIAAPGLVALRDMRARLKVDNENAKYLADHLSNLGMDVFPTESNIVICDLKSIDKTCSEVLDYLESKNILAVPFSDTLLRLTTHRHISRENVDTVIDVLKQAYFE